MIILKGGSILLVLDALQIVVDEVQLEAVAHDKNVEVHARQGGSPLHFQLHAVLRVEQSVASVHCACDRRSTTKAKRFGKKLLSVVAQVSESPPNIREASSK